MRPVAASGDWLLSAVFNDDSQAVRESSLEGGVAGVSGNTASHLMGATNREARMESGQSH